ncbi:MAG TPA: DUF58 domain-containing protein [Gammaproteobacteria bacterium]|nr:DUF58 domain-containing protein [Gammaproteobacteria bacterium]
MAARVNKIPGISIHVDDLIAVRNRLGSQSRSRLRRLNSPRSGAREIQRRGRGMEYDESRAYVYGDDARTMDWRVMARTGEAHTKVFAEEKERCCLIAIDLSASMFFGTRFAFKSWAAAQVAAHLGWLASYAGERIGGLVASPEYHSEIRPGKARSGLFGVFHHIARAAELRPPGRCDTKRLNYLLYELTRVAKPGADILLISDFLGSDRQTQYALSAICRHNQVHAYWIFDNSEVDDWPPGDYPILNQQDNIHLDLDDRQHRAWLHDQLQDHRQRVESLCARFNIPLLAVSCNSDISPQILQRLQTPS